MKLSKHEVASAMEMMDNLGPAVQKMHKAYRQKLDEEYVKPNPFGTTGEKDASSIRQGSKGGR